MLRGIYGAFVFCLLSVPSSTVVVAGPIVTLSATIRVSPETDIYVVGIDPDGETSYTAVEITIASVCGGAFQNPTDQPQFVPDSFTGVLGVGTVTGGFSILGAYADEREAGFTFTSLGGPPTSSFSGDLFQIVGDDPYFTVTSRFADGSGQEITEFETTLVANLAPSCLKGRPGDNFFSMQGALTSGAGVVDNAIELFADGSNDPTDPIDDWLDEPGALTVSIGDDPFGVFGAEIDGRFVDLSIDVAAARSLPRGTPLAADLIVDSRYGYLYRRLTAVAIPEPAASFGLVFLLVTGIGFKRRSHA